MVVDDAAHVGPVGSCAGVFVKLELAVREVEPGEGQKGAGSILLAHELELHENDRGDLLRDGKHSLPILRVHHARVELTGLAGHLLGILPHRYVKRGADGLLHKAHQGAFEQLEVDDRLGDGGEVGEEGRDVDPAGGGGDGGDGDGNPCTRDKGGCIGIECADHLLLLCRGLRVKVLREEGFMQEVNATKGILDVVGDGTVRINRLTDD